MNIEKHPLFGQWWCTNNFFSYNEKLKLLDVCEQLNINFEVCGLELFINIKPNSKDSEALLSLAGFEV